MKRCKDRYFAWDGDQPSDRMGLPEELAEKQRQRKDVLDKENLQLSLARKAHDQQMQLSTASHALSRQQDKQRNDDQMQLADLQHQQRKRQQQEMEAQRLMVLQRENDAAYTHQKRLGDVRMAESDHNTGKELEVLNQKKAIEGWRLDRMDQSDKKRHDLVMAQVKEQKRLMSSGYPAGQLAIMGRSNSIASSSHWSNVPD